MKPEVQGADKLQRIFRRMPELFTDNKLRAVHRRAVTPLISRIHRLTPVGKTGNLADSVGTENVKTDLGGIHVGYRRKGGFKGFAGHLIEFGTKPRFTKKSFAYRGQMKANPVVEPSFDQTADQVEKNIVKEEAAEVTKFLKRNV